MEIKEPDILCNHIWTSPYDEQQTGRADIKCCKCGIPKSTITAIAQQPTPVHNSEQQVCWDAVIRDMRQRDLMGLHKYGTRLQPFNGRDSLVDAYQEALDLVVYLKQMQMERDIAIHILRGLLLSLPAKDVARPAIERVVDILTGAGK